MSGQFEESEVVTVVKRSFVVERQLRKKYRCRCKQNVVTAPGSTKLQRGGRYSVEFAVEVAVSKYLDHLPLERQVRMMQREGLEIDSQPDPVGPAERAGAAPGAGVRSLGGTGSGRSGDPRR
jgi:transposase